MKNTKHLTAGRETLGVIFADSEEFCPLYLSTEKILQEAKW